MASFQCDQSRQTYRTGSDSAMPAVSARRRIRTDILHMITNLCMFAKTRNLTRLATGVCREQAAPARCKCGRRRAGSTRRGGSRSSMIKMAIEVGGTFTDLIWLDGAGEVRTHKLPSTPRDPSIGVINGLTEAL